MNCWNVLNIAPTHNTREIKRAYSTLLKTISPETEPEAFQRLNQAYKSALNTARIQTMNDASDMNNDTIDDTPSQLNNNSNTLADSTTSTSVESNSVDEENNLYNEQQVENSSNVPEGLIDDFFQTLHNIIGNPQQRESEAVWLAFLNNPVFDGFEFKEQTRNAVFAILADHFEQANVKSDGAYIPQSIVKKIADYYAWEDFELELAAYFSPTEIQRLLSYAYSNHDALNSSEVNAKTVNIGKVFLVLIAGIVLMALLFNGFINSKKSTKTTDIPESMPLVSFDERLLSCNKVFNAQPTEDFTLCLEQANAGNTSALKRIVWAYSQAGEYQNWRQVFDGLKLLSKSDKEAQVLLFTLMKFISKDEKLERQGETGIKRLANRNYAPANILLATLYALQENELEQTSNILWLLERAYESDPDALNPIDLAIVYANGFVSTKDIPKATELLLLAAEAYYPLGTNNIAWFLATLDENPFTTPELAVSLAKKVVDNPEYASRHTYVDTLAATYASAGDFEKAAQTQQRAIELIDELSWEQKYKDREKESFEERLNLYNAKQTLVEYSLNVDKKTFLTGLRENLVNRLFNKLKVTIVEPALTEDLTNEPRSE